MKIILFLVDGMRPDGIEEIEIAQKIIGESTYTMNGETVFPSVTLPCHMSLFHSVVPERHGVTTNVYVPQVRPVNGLFEVLKQNGKKCASFYSWEELRDVSRPGSPAISCLFSGKSFGYETASQLLTDSLIQSVRSFDLDFCFLYFGDPDEKGHKYGWMSSEYHRAVQLSWNCIDKVIRELGDEYTYMSGCVQLAERIHQELTLLCRMDQTGIPDEENLFHLRCLDLEIPENGLSFVHCSENDSIVTNYHLKKLLEARAFLMQMLEDRPYKKPAAN